MEEPEKMDNVIVLYPGSYKPVHSGHISLIFRHLNQPDVRCLKLLIGPGNRDGITQEIAFDIVDLLLKDDSRILIEKVSYPSPVLTAFKYIETADPSTYALASANKDNDYERVERFCRQHKEGGKYHDNVPEGVNFTVIPIDVCPITYVGRSDEKNGTEISGR